MGYDYDYESKSIHDDLMVLKASKSPRSRGKKASTSSSSSSAAVTSSSPPPGGFKSPIHKMKKSVGSLFGAFKSPEATTNKKKSARRRFTHHVIDEDESYSHDDDDDDDQDWRSCDYEEDEYDKGYSRSEVGEMDFNDSLMCCDLEDAIGKALERTQQLNRPTSPPKMSPVLSFKKKKNNKGRK